jgi:hypothetical protein
MHCYYCKSELKDSGPIKAVSSTSSGILDTFFHKDCHEEFVCIAGLGIPQRLKDAFEKKQQRENQ